MEYSCRCQSMVEDVVYQLKVSKGFKRQMLLMSVMVVNVLSDLGVKVSTPKLNYYLVLDFLIFERGRM
jgi:hypothetical protein